MPLQGALNAAVYGWSLPSIRDVYRFMLLGTDSLEAAAEARHEKQVPSPAESADSYSPPHVAEINGKVEIVAGSSGIVILNPSFVTRVFRPLVDHRMSKGFVEKAAAYTPLLREGGMAPHGDLDAEAAVAAYQARK